MQSGQVRAIVSEIPSDAGDLHSILLDSGADAAVFPSEFAECGVEAGEQSARLHDAQGREILVHSMKDVEVHLLDQSGKLVVLRERVALSPHVTQSILCYGRLLKAGWGINPAEQTLTHSAGVRVPIELQNMSVTVKGWIRVISSGDDSVATQPQPQFSVCAVRADVTSDCGVGRHHTDHFQDPTLFRPQLEGRRFRTTLLRDHGQWFVMELCEPLETLVDLSAPFYLHEGPRDTLTIITNSEKDPVLMCFKLLDDEEIPLFEDVARQEVDIDVAPEDEVLGQEIAFKSAEGAGVGAPVPLKGRIVMSAAPTDHVELTADSSLRALRVALTHYGLSTSGPKAKCFNRLLTHQKQLELQVVHGAAEQAQGELARTPKSVPLQIPPDEEVPHTHSISTMVLFMCLLQSSCRSTSMHRSFETWWCSNNFI